MSQRSKSRKKGNQLTFPGNNSLCNCVGKLIAQTIFDCICTLTVSLLLFCSQSVPCVAKTLQFICARRNLSTPISHPNPNIFFAFLNKVQKYSVSYLFYRMQSSWINRNGKKFPSYLKLFTLFKYSYNKSFMLF